MTLRLPELNHIKLDKAELATKGHIIRIILTYLKGWSSWALLTIVLSTNSHAEESVAFNTLNLNPMIQIFGLPSLSNQIVNAKNSFQIELEQQAGNYHSQSSLQSEHVKLDGETWRTNITIAYGLTNNSQLSVSAPYLRHSSGYMDNLIYSWHDAFGMPQGERTKESNNEIDIQYNTNQYNANQYNATRQNQIDIDSPESGIGDIRIKYAYKLPAFSREILLQSEVKLPTGDANTLTGSGGTDLSFGFMFNDGASFSHQQITIWGGAAATYLSQADAPLSKEQKTLVWSARTGMGWRLNDTITLKTQLDGHSAAYDSNTTELGSGSMMLTVGGDYYFSPDYRLEIAAVEDLITEASPDIIFSAKLSVTLN